MGKITVKVAVGETKSPRWMRGTPTLDRDEAPIGPVQLSAKALRAEELEGAEHLRVTIERWPE